MSISLSQMSETHMDILRELGNIGSGYAATSLSVLMDRKVLVSGPEVRLSSAIPGDGVKAAPSGGECIAARIDFTGDTSGAVLFLFTMKEAEELTAGLTVPVSYEHSDDMSSLWHSAISEIGNILASSYLRALSIFTGLKINMGPSRLMMADAAAATWETLSLFGSADETFMSIEESFLFSGQKECGKVMLLMNGESINPIMHSFEVEN